MSNKYNIRSRLESNREVYIDELKELYERLSLVFWDEFHTYKMNCTFCARPATHCNQEIKEYAQSHNLSTIYHTYPLHACESCMYDLENKDVDIADPEDHPLSKGLRDVISDWIKRNCYITITTAEFFEKYGADYKLYCGHTLESHQDDNIANSVCGTYFACEQCAQKYGFRYDELVITRIIKYLRCYRFVDYLCKVPKYTPDISLADRDKLNKFVHDNLSTFDFSEMHACAAQFNARNWISVHRTRKHFCCFSSCDRPATMYNKYIKKHSCDICYTYIQYVDIADPNSSIHYGSQSYLIREKLQDKLDEILHIETKASILYDKYNVEYCRCILCKKVIQPNDNVVVTNNHFTHVNCFKQNKRNKFHSTVPLNDVVELPSFQLDVMMKLITQ